MLYVLVAAVIESFAHLFGNFQFHIFRSKVNATQCSTKNYLEFLAHILTGLYWSK